VATISVKKAISKVGTQQQMADFLGVSRQTIKVWVRNNRVSPNYVVRFCQITGLTPEQVNGFAKDVLTFKKKAESRREGMPASVIG